jgi:glycosyltransferase involved in cell wall biosynthesis
MKILLIHKHHYNLGGAEKYYLDLSRLLTQKGHQVAHFAMKDGRNLRSPWSKYFVSGISFEGAGWSLLKALGRMTFSFEAVRKMGKLIEDFKPDIAHIQNIYYHISPSILLELKKKKIPIVYTVHDYHLISPNVNLFHNGKVCEIGKKGLYRIVLHKCVRDSFLISGITSSIFYLHKLFNLYKGSVDFFISPSAFMKKKLIEYGFSPKTIVQLPNFIDATKYQERFVKGSYIFYFGRLFEHKGTGLLIKVAKLLPNIKFKIAGDGPEEQKLKKLVGESKINNVEFMGKLSQEKIKKAISYSSFCVVPSLWYENMPYSILEAFASGKPVVTSQIGGIPEIVEDGKSGLLFKPGDVEQFGARIESLWGNPGLLKKMGSYARKTAEKKFGSESHYKSLMEIYQSAIKAKAV